MSTRVRVDTGEVLTGVCPEEHSLSVRMGVSSEGGTVLYTHTQVSDTSDQPPLSPSHWRAFSLPSCRLNH
jgi:hypothetical protein